MPGPPYRGLRILLGIFSLLTAAGGLVIIFSDRPMIMRLFLHPPESEVSTLLLVVAKEMGGFILMLSVMLFFAYLDARRLYPGYLIWGRSLVRLALAALLFYLRPREGVREQS